MKSKALFFLLLFFSLTSCVKVSEKIEPSISYRVDAKYFDTLDSAFPPLTEKEKTLEWSKEWHIAMAFAKEFDFYRAISTFLRAKILISHDAVERIMEIDYAMILCFYLSEKFDDVVETFEKSLLAKNVDSKNFPAYQDLLLILYDSYDKLEDKKRSANLLKVIEQRDKKVFHHLSLSRAFQHAEEPEILHLMADHPEKESAKKMLSSYHKEEKSLKTAALANAFLPGAGYLYLGQKKTAMTAFLVNSLFIAATYQFFHKGYTAAGIITLSFEAGWYFGGIYGAREQAKFYNEQLYEKKASAYLQTKKLFPLFLLEHTF